MPLRFIRSFRAPALAGAALVLLAACGDSPVENAAAQPEAELFPGGHRTSTSPAAPTVSILWQNVVDGQRSLWLTAGAQWNGVYHVLPQVQSWWSMAAFADFTGDGLPDIVMQDTQTGDRWIWSVTSSDWALRTATLPNVPTDWSIAGAGDFDGDGKRDLVWQNTRTGERSIWFMNGTSYAGRYALLPQVSIDWRISAVGDFNNDGRPDLVWENTSGLGSIWFMNGSSWGGAYALLPQVPAQWRIAAAADFDGDARPDLLWQNVQTGQRSVWFMSGSAWYGAYTLLPDVATAWSIAGAAVVPSGLAYPPNDIVPPTVTVSGVVDGGSYATGPAVSVYGSDDVGFGPLYLRVSVRRTVGATSYCATSAQVMGGMLNGLDPSPSSAACPTLSLAVIGAGVFTQPGSYTLTAATVDEAGNSSAIRTVVSPSERPERRSHAEPRSARRTA